MNAVNALEDQDIDLAKEELNRELNSYNKIKVPPQLLTEDTDYLEVTVEKDDCQATFLTQANPKITVRKSIRNSLEIESGESVNVDFDELERAGRSEKLFCDSKIDILSLVPVETKKGFNIVVSAFEDEGEERLRLWHAAGTKGSRKIELKRYVDPRTFGELLGQYQAEGRKTLQGSRLEFTNKLINEHMDFIDNLCELGVEEKLISAICIYNSDKVSEKRVGKYCDSYEQETGVNLEEIYEQNTRGPKSFKTIIRNGPLTEFLISSIQEIRNRISCNTKGDKEMLARGFLAKLLTGDGTLDTTVSPARQYNSPSINIKIVDQDLEALRDYRDILENLGFNPHVNEKHIMVKSSCSLENLLFLYRINAFRNTKNWKKLVLTVSILLEGRRYRTYKRFLDFKDREEISTSTLMEEYSVSRSSAGQWLRNKKEEGFLKVIRQSPFPVLYRLTSKGKRFARDLERVLEFKEEIKKEKDVKSAREALNSLKTKFD